MSVVARFAPSPTGFLHIGGARTALFNLLFARHHGGKFLLRIEDTDRQRSTEAAIAAIFDGLRWLDLAWDDEPVFQSTRAARHVAAARQLLDAGKAYWCYATPEELAEMRERARAQGQPVRYDGRWRDRPAVEAPAGVAPALRLKAPREGETRVEDLVQGCVTVANDQLDDMVLLRGDGTPTYMLAVVVDDHDMGVTHVIRGDDHLTNTFRQIQLYQAFGWPLPAFAHIPLIHGADGAKLSKRHGALGVDAYRDQGLLPEAVCNYLLRLGWSHGDEEIIDRAQAIAWFDLDAVGRSAARFDMAKLTSLNAHYLRQADDARLIALIWPRLKERFGEKLSPRARERLERGMAGLKERARTLIELADSAAFYVSEGPIVIEGKAERALAALEPAVLRDLAGELATLLPWRAPEIEAAVRRFCEITADPPLTLRDVAQPLRAALTGATVSPPIFDVMEALGRDETLARLRFILAEVSAKTDV